MSRSPFPSAIDSALTNPTLFDPGQSPDSAGLFALRLRAITPSLRGYARSLLGASDDSEDLVQDTLLSAWRSRHTYKADSNFKAWIFHILRNRFYSMMVHPRPAQDVDGALAAAMATGPAQEWSVLCADAVAAIGRLSPEFRDALTLVACGASYDEAAEICRCSVGTVKSRVSRARARLVEALGLEERSFAPSSSDEPAPASPGARHAA